MKHLLGAIGVMALSLSLVIPLQAAEKETKKGKTGIKNMSQEELVKLAMSAAPEHISKDATIMVPGPDGKLVEAKKGSNGFTCIPDVDGMSVPDPICFDAESGKWVNDLMSGAPKPTNTAPGIAYMARGGWHFEKDGKILMKNEAGAKTMQEPPHWMVFWPFDSKTSGIPSMPSKLGSYVMWDGTPYAHMMIYQDPKKMK
ncbi:MAG: hypothetical protein HY282_01470 [Nitrospirae bacterium]|nr:hypothetical protein [Candidatus Manganitrophaceae bacterium]